MSAFYLIVMLPFSVQCYLNAAASDSLQDIYGVTVKIVSSGDYGGGKVFKLSTLQLFVA